MKRYFNDLKARQVIMVESKANHVLNKMSIEEVFGSNEDIVEVTKSEYLRMKYFYESENETNLTMTISG